MSVHFDAAGARRLLRIVTGAAIVLSSWYRTATAAPNIWERAREPERATAYAAWLQAQRLQHYMLPQTGSPLAAKQSQLAAEGLRVRASRQGLDRDGLLLFADCLIAAWDPSGRGEDPPIELQHQGRGILLRLLPEAAPAVAARGWAQVGLVGLRLGEYSRALSALDRALALQWEPATRNRLRRWMALAHLQEDRGVEALAAYRLAWELAESERSRALSAWGMAVAWDLQRNYLASMKVAKGISAPALKGVSLERELGIFRRSNVYYFKGIRASGAAFGGSSDSQVASLQGAQLTWSLAAQAEQRPTVLERIGWHRAHIAHRVESLVEEDPEDEEDVEQGIEQFLDGGSWDRLHPPTEPDGDGPF